MDLSTASLKPTTALSEEAYNTNILNTALDSSSKVQRYLEKRQHHPRGEDGPGAADGRRAIGSRSSHSDHLQKLRSATTLTPRPRVVTQTAPAQD